ncbi:MAG: hypothetical protein ACFFDW_13880 [Candidatus Thorarchaeota archaeon]
MTGQFPDMFHYNNEKYELVGVEGEKLYNPKEHGLDPQFRCTACRRGYVLTYLINENQLTLDDILINLNEETDINGVKPAKPDELGSPFMYQYKNVKMKIDFTGKLLLGKDIVPGLYEHMGFQKANTYKKVIELTFKKGILESTKDISKKMEEERKKNSKK